MAARNRAVAVVMLFSLMVCVTHQVSASSVAAQFDAGRAFYEQDQYERAVACFTRTLALDPEHAPSYLFLGRSVVHLERWLQAISYLRGGYLRLTSAEQKVVVGELRQALLNGARELLDKGNFVNAIALLEEALRLSPDSLEARDDLATVLTVFGEQLLSEGRYNEALSAYSRSVSLNPKSPRSQIGLARAWLASNHLSQALLTVEVALETWPGNAELEALLKQMTQAHYKGS